MILYKALFDYQSSEVQDLFFEKDDIIEFLSESSPDWYQGRNIMSGDSGLFPTNFVEIIIIPQDIDEETIYIVRENNNNLDKGTFLIENHVNGYFLSCYLMTDKNNTLIQVLLSTVIKLKIETQPQGYMKCIANCNYDKPAGNELGFRVGDTIWMERKINKDFGEGILKGMKGVFPLEKVSNEIIVNKRINIDRKNIWITLFDYSETHTNDLSIRKGDKLKFLDRLDNNWNLMQNELGKVGMVPVTYVKNISINSPIRLSVSESETNDNSDTNELTDADDDDDNNNNNQLEYKIIPNTVLQELRNRIVDSSETEYENHSYYNSRDKHSTLISDFRALSVGTLVPSENSYEESSTLRRSDINNIPDENEIPETVLEQFNKREKRIENDIEVINDDIKSIENKLVHEDTCDDILAMTCNLAFLKEERKTKLKELESVKDQRKNLLSGNLQDIDEDDYESIKLSSILEKKMQKRCKIIEEILETEKKFIKDLKITLVAFDKNLISVKISDQDFNLLFGDLESVIAVAEEFLSKFSVNMEDGLDKIAVGSVFLQSVSSFEEVYKEYCINYDRKLDLINKKGKISNFTEFVSEGLNRLNDLGVFTSTLDMMLVKPLQRFLKYPLFLKTIIENTLPDHPDINDLLAASSEFYVLAQKINEKKRFEELRQLTFDRTEKWHVRTIHAIQKKPKRVIASISGVVHNEDTEFEETVIKFKELKKCISFFIETVFILRDNLKEILNLYSAITDDLTSIIKSNFGSQLHFYLVACKRGETDYFKTHTCILDSLVLNPLNKLLELFSGPVLLIKKRQSKYIDYLAMKQRCDDKETSRVQIDKLEQLKNQYLAINNTLKHELPILISKSSVIFNECIGNYLQLSTSTLQNSILSLQNLTEDDQLPTEEEQRNCRNQQNEILTFLQRDLISFNPQYRNSITKGDFSSCFLNCNNSNANLRNCVYHQTEEDVIKLREKFDNENLARVKKDFVPTKKFMQRKNKKDINTGIYFQSLQIKNAVESLIIDCEDLYSISNIEILRFIYTSTCSIPMPLRTALCKNLSLTTFPKFAILMLNDFVKCSYLLTSKEANTTLFLLAILWNTCDSSESLVEQLIKFPNFKEYISAIVRKLDPKTEEGYQFILSALNIINNIVRREKYQNTFDGYELSDQIFTISNMDKTNRTSKLAFAFLNCFIFPLSDQNESRKLIEKFKEEILIYLDGVSNADDFQYEGCSANELLTMLKISTTNRNIKVFYSENLTLKNTLIRFLCKNQKIDLVMSIIDLVYSKITILELENLYINKTGNLDSKIVEHFRKLQTK